MALVRHGETKQPNAEGRYTSRPGPQLTARGRVQAKRLGESLRRFHVRQVYCSDLPRALTTAGIVAEEVGLHPNPLASLREVNSGSLDGCTLEQIEREFPQFLPWVHVGHYQRFATPEFHVPYDLRFPDGESIADLGARAVPTFAELCTASLGSLIVIVSHAWLTQVLICHVLGIPTSLYYRITSAYAAVSVVQVDAEGRGMVHSLNGAIPLEETARGRLPRAEPVENTVYEPRPLGDYPDA